MQYSEKRMKKREPLLNQVPKAIGPYSQVIKVGDLLYTSGQVALSPKRGSQRYHLAHWSRKKQSLLFPKMGYRYLSGGQYGSL
jgi:hypothetical protein